MSNIDEIIKIVKKNDIDIPIKIQNAINSTLNNKRKRVNCFAKFIPVWISVFFIIIGSFGVYAISGWTVEGIPVLEWLGIKFSNSYVDYKEEVSEQNKTYNKTTVELVGTLSSDYVTVFEFDVKLSDKDKEYLRLGEILYTDKDGENLEKVLEDIEKERERLEKELEDLQKQNVFTDEHFEIWRKQSTEQLNEKKKIAIENIEETKRYINSIELGFNKQERGEELSLLHDLPHTKDSVYIDGEEVWCRNYQTVEKISDNEYKVYHIFLLTDEDLKGKTSYNITLKNNIIANVGKLKAGEKKLHEVGELTNTGNNARIIDIDGEFSVDVSKEKILENSNIIKLTDKKSTYKNVTQEIEEISINPIQTIIRAKTTITGVDSNKRYFYDDDIQSPLWVEFKITDENGKKLTSTNCQTQKILTKGDGTVEEWYPGDINTMSTYINGTFELTEYIILENSNADKLIITPSFQSQERETYKEIYCELDPLIIELR